MDGINALEAEANRRRADFAESLRKLRRKLTPLALADEGLRRLDPQAQVWNEIAALRNALQKRDATAR